MPAPGTSTAPVAFSTEMDIGAKFALQFTLPQALPRPRIEAFWHAEDQVAEVSIDFDGLELHLEAHPEDLDYHFHDADGAETTDSPWSASITKELIPWAEALAADVKRRMPAFDCELEEIMSFFKLGLTTHVLTREGDGVDFIEFESSRGVTIQMWPGSGEGTHHHVEGRTDLLHLTWKATGDSELIHVGQVRTDPETGSYTVEAESGVDWAIMGTTENAALEWYEIDHLNCLAVDEIRTRFRAEVLDRLAGVDHPKRSPYR